MALTDKLSAIGSAIREKTGKTDLLTLEQMPTEIAAIETGGSSAAEMADVTIINERSNTAYLGKVNDDFTITEQGFSKNTTGVQTQLKIGQMYVFRTTGSQSSNSGSGSGTSGAAYEANMAGTNIKYSKKYNYGYSSTSSTTRSYNYYFYFVVTGSPAIINIYS